MIGLLVLLIALALLVAVLLVWRVAGWPCPPWLVPLLENPYVDAVAGADRLVERAGIGPGMRVLDAGCGPGRLTLPAARAVGPTGSVTAVDIEPRMLERLRERLAAAGLNNVEIVHAGLGDGKLPTAVFDRALLVTVLGEIPDKESALREIFAALRPGGRLEVTEVLPDPHYQRLARVRELAFAAGFREHTLQAGLLSFTLALERPGPVG